MTKRKAAIDPDEVPELSAEDFARAVPLAQAPERLVRAIRRGRGKQKAPTKMLISLRLSQEVIERYRRTGRGWQARMNTDLERASKRLERRDARGSSRSLRRVRSA